MGFKKGNPGKPKGATSHWNRKVEDMAMACKVDPFQVLLWVASGDWEELGYDSASRTSFAASGIEFEEPWIKLSDRVQAAKEAAKYLYAAKQSVAISTGDGGIKIIVEEYKNKNE